MQPKLAWWEILAIVGFIILIVLRMAHVFMGDFYILALYAIVVCAPLYAVYFVIRIAVRHGMKDCVKDYRNEQHVK